MSSLMDTWLSLVDVEVDRERNHGLYVLKSRGMSHSNQVREYLLTNRGVELVDVYLGDAGKLTGSARLAQGAISKADGMRKAREADRKHRDIERRRAAVERQIAEIREIFEAEEESVLRSLEIDGWPGTDQTRSGSSE